MRKKLLLFFIFLFMITLIAENTYALGNGEVVNQRLGIRYNVQMLDKIRAISLEGEWGMSPTLALDTKYIYTESDSYLDLHLKFKLYESNELDLAGRFGLASDFRSSTPVHKTLGLLFTKNQNSFIKISGGVDYSMVNGDIGYFIGGDYRLISSAYVQFGWQKFIGQRNTQGFVLGLRTDL